MECGADVNAVNKQGDTPLHLIVAYSKPITDFFTLHSIIAALVKRGAHTDVVNYKGKGTCNMLPRECKFVAAFIFQIVGCLELPNPT